VHRVYGRWDGHRGAITASINEPCVRGAAHATLERRMLVDIEEFRHVTKAHVEDKSARWKEDGQDGVDRYSFIDTQGLAQALMLFSDESRPAPLFTYQEFALTDAVGHDYGPHHEAIALAVAETDKRIGKILSLLEERGLLESTLFVVTADHGMAPIDPDLAANQVQAVLDAGLKAVVPAPLIYLLDMEVIVEPAMDGRTVTVTVLENDADVHGEKPPVAEAEVRVIGPATFVLRSPFESLRTSGKAGPAQGVLAEAKTDGFGVAGLPLPVDADPARLVVSVHHEQFNPRHVRLDGSNVVEDIRARLYGKLEVGG